MFLKLKLAAESVPVACLEQFDQFLIDTGEHQHQYRNRMHEENCQQKTLKWWLYPENLNNIYNMNTLSLYPPKQWILWIWSEYTAAAAMWTVLVRDFTITSLALTVFYLDLSHLKVLFTLKKQDGWNVILKNKMAAIAVFLFFFSFPTWSDYCNCVIVFSENWSYLVLSTDKNSEIFNICLLLRNLFVVL